MEMDDLKLNSGYTFWVQQIQNGNLKNFGSNLKSITTISTAKQFWEVFQFMKKTNDLPKDWELYLFKQGIQPLWQDPNNSKGGRFIFNIDKKKSNKLWENVVLSMISPTNKYSQFINGARIKIKQKFDKIQIWMNSNAKNKQNLQGIKNYLKQNLQLSQQRAYTFDQFNY